MASTPQTSAMARLVERLARLPGIGNRSAQRLAFYLLKASAEEANELAAAITDLKRNTRQCSVCCNVSETDPCPICTDDRRDHGLVLVVEQPGDLATIESTGMYRGVYHVLMGRLAPLDGLGAGELHIDPLIQRIEAGGIREVIIGTNPTLEGDGTGLYLVKQLERLGVKITRLARGLPTGANLEMVSKAVLADALQGRQTV